MAKDARPTGNKRADLRSQVDVDPEATVVSDSRGASNYGYSYHFLDDAGETLCGKDSVHYEEMTVRTAHNRDKAPCQMCLRIRE
jgi:hypothetical protein